MIFVTRCPPYAASSGNVTPTALHEWVDTAWTSVGWGAGVTAWQWSATAAGPWLSTVYPGDGLGRATPGPVPERCSYSASVTQLPTVTPSGTQLRTPSQSPSPLAAASTALSTDTIIIIGAAGGGGFILLLLLCAVCWCRYYCVDKSGHAAARPMWRRAAGGSVSRPPRKFAGPRASQELDGETATGSSRSAQSATGEGASGRTGMQQWSSASKDDDARAPRPSAGALRDAGATPKRSMGRTRLEAESLATEPDFGDDTSNPARGVATPASKYYPKTPVPQRADVGGEPLAGPLRQGPFPRPPPGPSTFRPVALVPPPQLHALSRAYSSAHSLQSRAPSSGGIVEMQRLGTVGGSRAYYRQQQHLGLAVGGAGRGGAPRGYRAYLGDADNLTRPPPLPYGDAVPLGVPPMSSQIAARGYGRGEGATGAHHGALPRRQYG